MGDGACMPGRRSHPVIEEVAVTRNVSGSVDTAMTINPDERITENWQEKK